MQLPMLWLDAFASKRFSGNPAAVVPLERWLDDNVLQSIAAENGLSETAFLVAQSEGYHLRWMTPTVEVDLCGHATLASAWVVFHRLEPSSRVVRFQTRSGTLVVERDENQLVMNFPSYTVTRDDAQIEAVHRAFGIAPREVHVGRSVVAVYESEDQIRSIKPDMNRVMELSRASVIVTAQGRECDFVSRFFAPAKGVPEDPVTGSAHCTLAPFWGARLGRDEMLARQLSARGGEMRCKLEGDRVVLKGQAILYLEGTLTIDAG